MENGKAAATVKSHIKGIFYTMYVKLTFMSATITQTVLNQAADG